ncbi:MAG: hypothetical protein U9R79_05925 [Armatimonadota bacterium]|nr:hypothetical protein [Armatimonadota bacterium]
MSVDPSYSELAASRILGEQSSSAGELVPALVHEVRHRLPSYASRHARDNLAAAVRDLLGPRGQPLADRTPAREWLWAELQCLAADWAKHFGPEVLVRAHEIGTATRPPSRVD